MEVWNLMASFAGPNLITDNLVLSLDASNTNSYPGSGTTWFDMSDKHNHGTLTNGPTFDSNNLGSIDFDGTNDHVALNSHVMNSFSKISIFCFVKFNRVNSTNTILDLRDGSGDGMSFIMSNPSGKKLFSGMNSDNIVGNKVFTTGQIHSCAVTYDGSTAKLYVDGKEDASKSISETFDLDTSKQSKIAIRSFSTGSATGAEINLYNLYVYSEALTATQIQQNYMALKGRFGL